MDRFVVREAVHPQTASSRKHRRQGLWLSGREVDGKFCSSTKNRIRNLMLGSYSEIGKVHGSEYGGHSYLVWEACFRPVVTSLEFDAKGVYLASARVDGLLSIYDFETIYCFCIGDLEPKDATPVVVVPTGRAIQSARWSPANEDEVGYVASETPRIYFHDIARISCRPSEVLKLKAGYPWPHQAGFLDLCFFKSGRSRVLACAKDGHIHLWDRRMGQTPFSSLCVPPAAGAVESMHLSADDQMVVGGTEFGFIHSWDLRGGRQSAAFFASSEVYHPPLCAVSIAKLLNQVPSLTEQTDIPISGLHSVSVNPSHGGQLAFHLNNGWTGVMNLLNLTVTHLHCPPPPWLSPEAEFFKTSFHRRRPTWLPTSSVYAVGSHSKHEIYLLDFTAGHTSHCSVVDDGSEMDACTGRKVGAAPCRVAISQRVAAIAAHPTAVHLVAGTEDGSLLMIGQKKKSYSGDDA